MKNIVNKEEMRREWILNHWYEKWVYVIGVTFTILFTISFMVGFIQGLLGN